MAEFVSINEDKFEKKITYRTTLGLNISCPAGIFLFGNFHLKLRRLVKMPELDSMLIDVILDDCKHKYKLSEGKIIIIADDETITLPAHSNESGYTSDGFYDSCYYELGRDNLKKICDSNSVSMKVYTGVGAQEIDNVNAFAVYCKLFYNVVYDNTAYTDIVTKALGEFTKSSAEESKFSDIKLDGSGANGGCMGMIALMLTLGGAAIGGVCSLI